MDYYLRTICEDRWLVGGESSFADMEDEAITTDLRCDKNEWSLYRIKGGNLEQENRTCGSEIRRIDASPAEVSSFFSGF